MQTIITAGNVQEAVQALRHALPGFRPRMGLVLGSGLGTLVEAIEHRSVIPYAEVPHMNPSTAPGHVGRFVCGEIAGCPVICMQGRLHLYEGYDAYEIGFPIHLMHALGAESLVVTNAAGGIDTTFEVGDLMLIEDHINLLARNPCIGPDDQQVGPRFFDMTHAYDPGFRAAAHVAAEHCGISLREGVYLGTTGPSFETPAEIRAFRTLGAAAVGMSTVLEVIAANQCGMSVLGISLISNPACGVLEVPLSMDDVAQAAEQGAGRMERLIVQVITEAL